MKYLYFLSTLSLFFLSCTKKVDTAASDEIYSIEKVAGAYKAGSLAWEKINGATLTSGTDLNATFSVTYNANSVNITISTTAPITIKTLSLPLTFKQESTIVASTGNAVYVFSDSANTISLTKNFNFNSSMVKVATNLSIGGRIDVYYSPNPYSFPTTSERYNITGTKQ